VNWHEGFFVAANFSSRKQAVPVPAGARVLIGSKDLDPAGVAIWVAK
jgi:beta-galactosidase